MPEGQLSISIEHEVAAHLRHVQLLGMPDLSAQGETYVTPNRPWWRDRQNASPPEPEAPVGAAFRIGEPQVRIARALREALEMVRTSKRDDGDLSIQLHYLPIELPQLR